MAAMSVPSRVRLLPLLLGAVVAGSVIVSCGEPSSGIAGTTIVDVGCPTQPVGEDCPTRPLPARILVTDGEGEIVGRALSGEAGEFNLRLPPGEYNILASNMEGTPLPYAEQVPVTVRAGEVTQVTVEFESGVL